MPIQKRKFFQERFSVIQMDVGNGSSVLKKGMASSFIKAKRGERIAWFIHC